VPADLRADLSNLHELLRESIRSYYEGLGSSYVASVRDYAVAASGDITQAASTASVELTAAASSLRVSADAMTPELRKAIETGAEHLRVHLDEFNAAFGQHFPKAVVNLQVALGSAAQALEGAKAVLDGMTSASKIAAEHTQEWTKLGVSLHELRVAVQGNREPMERSADAIKSAADANTRASDALGKAVVVRRPPKAPISRWKRFLAFFNGSEG
jgi:hypothetical protein